GDRRPVSRLPRSWPAARSARRRDYSHRRPPAPAARPRPLHAALPTYPPAPAPPPAEHTATNDQAPACVTAGQRHDSCIGATTRAAGCEPTWPVAATATRGRLVGILTAWRGGCRGDASPLFRAWRGWPSLRPRACRASRVGVRTFSCGL